MARTKLTARRSTAAEHHPRFKRAGEHNACPSAYDSGSSSESQHTDTLAPCPLSREGRCIHEFENEALYKTNLDLRLDLTVAHINLTHHEFDQAEFKRLKAAKLDLTSRFEDEVSRVKAFTDSLHKLLIESRTSHQHAREQLHEAKLGARDLAIENASLKEELRKQREDLLDIVEKAKGKVECWREKLRTHVELGAEMDDTMAWLGPFVVFAE